MTRKVARAVCTGSLGLAIDVAREQVDGALDAIEKAFAGARCKVDPRTNVDPYLARAMALTARRAVSSPPGRTPHGLIDGRAVSGEVHVATGEVVVDASGVHRVDSITISGAGSVGRSPSLGRR